MRKRLSDSRDPDSFGARLAKTASIALASLGLLAVLVAGRLTAQEPAGSATDSEAPSTPSLPAVALPGDVEKAVAEQLEELRELAVAALEVPERDDAERAEAVGELGRHYHAYGFTAAALSVYELAAELAPRDFRWPYLTAYIAQGEGRLDEALELYERALAIVPGVPPTLIRMAAVNAELGNAQRAEWLFGEALRADPNSAAALAGLGELLLAQDRAAEAVTLLERALLLANEANRLYYPLAQAYRKLGEEDKARELLAWRGSVGVKPADPVIDSLEKLKTGERVYLLQGQAAFRAGRYGDAAARFREAVEINPNSIAGWIDLGSALGQAGEVGEAIAAFERAVELAPGNETALFNLGVLQSRLGEYDRAIDLLSQAGQFAPADGQIRYELAEALRRAGRWQDSIVHFDAAITALPAEEAPRLGKAQALSRLGEHAAAREVLEAGLKEMPSSVVLGEALSRVLVLSEDAATRDELLGLRLAVGVFEQSQELDDAEWVAEILAQVDRCEEAAGWQREIVKQALEAGQPDQLLDRLRASLARFEAGAPCRLSAPGP